MVVHLAHTIFSELLTQCVAPAASNNLHMCPNASKWTLMVHSDFWLPGVPLPKLSIVLCFLMAPDWTSARNSYFVSCSNYLVLSFLWPLMPQGCSILPVVSHFPIRASPFVRSTALPISAGLYLEHPSRLPYNQSWSRPLQSPVPVRMSLPLPPASSSLPTLVVFFLRASASLNRRALLAFTPYKFLTP